MSNYAREDKGESQQEDRGSGSSNRKSSSKTRKPLKLNLKKPEVKLKPKLKPNHPGQEERGLNESEAGNIIGKKKYQQQRQNEQAALTGLQARIEAQAEEDAGQPQPEPSSRRNRRM